MVKFLTKTPVIICLSFLSLTSCMNASTRYKSPTQAQNNNISICQVTSFGVVSTIIAGITYKNCKDKYEKAGWKEVSSK